MTKREMESEVSTFVPPIELGDRENYRYIPTAEVTSVLEQFGYGPKKRFVHALYLSPDSSKAVGVTRVSEELCEDHFVGNPVFRGFDEGEAIAQTLLLLMHFSGQISEGYTPRLGKSTISPKWPVVPPVDLNIVAERLEDNSFGGYGRILCGETVVAEGIINGSVIPRQTGDRILERRKRIQANSTPLFPIRD